jgi:uncharacterized protein
MNRRASPLSGAVLSPLPSGALWWEEARLLCVSDLHLGKCLRPARAGGPVLPPYETIDTLTRLDADLARPARDGRLPRRQFRRRPGGRGRGRGDGALARPDAGRAALDLDRGEPRCRPRRARRHASGGASGGAARVPAHRAGGEPEGEISGHYHPKASVSGRAGRVTRACFLHDGGGRSCPPTAPMRGPPLDRPVFARFSAPARGRSSRGPFRWSCRFPARRAA